ncbi:uncharacterized protein [Antedon mediterranea]|uniref:uncharacterized protein isoform X2 n=1 Tax=Antedon mediterranea TaxID=105859 RepID=UPI003AF72D4F
MCTTLLRISVTTIVIYTVVGNLLMNFCQYEDVILDCSRNLSVISVIWFVEGKPVSAFTLKTLGLQHRNKYESKYRIQSDNSLKILNISKTTECTCSVITTTNILENVEWTTREYGKPILSAMHGCNKTCFVPGNTTQLSCSVSNLAHERDVHISWTSTYVDYENYIEKITYEEGLFTSTIYAKEGTELVFGNHTTTCVLSGKATCGHSQSILYKADEDCFLIT